MNPINAIGKVKTIRVGLAGNIEKVILGISQTKRLTRIIRVNLYDLTTIFVLNNNFTRISKLLAFTN